MARASAAGDDEAERLLAEVFCRRASARVTRLLDSIEDNDDEAMASVAGQVYGPEEPPPDA